MLLHHSSAALRWGTGVRYLVELRLVHHVHLHGHSLQVHVLERILVVEHIIDRNLRLSSRLLAGHRQVVALVHRELVLTFLVRVLDDLVHGYLVANGRR